MAVCGACAPGALRPAVGGADARSPGVRGEEVHQGRVRPLPRGVWELQGGRQGEGVRASRRWHPPTEDECQDSIPGFAHRRVVTPRV